MGFMTSLMSFLDSPFVFLLHCSRAFLVRDFFNVVFVLSIAGSGVHSYNNWDGVLVKQI